MFKGGVDMENTMSVAKALYDMYYEQNGAYMDEMKMHKLMYFAQRESLMYNNEPLFGDSFFGWKYGPVLKAVRSAYMSNDFLTKSFVKVSDDTMKLLRKVMEMYGSLSSWKLSSLSHGEFSWKKARAGLNPADNGDVELSLAAMKVDAVREQMYRRLAMK